MPIAERLSAYGLLRATHQRLRMARLYCDNVVQWRVEVARQMGVRVGKNCRFYSLNVFSEGCLVEIGDDVIVSGNVVFVTHDGGVYVLRDHIPNVQGDYGRIKIGNNCFIGMNAVILPNVHIGNNCIVAAGSVVRGSFGDNVVIMGNPATVVLSLRMYLAIKRASASTIISEEYAYPNERLPPQMQEILLRDIPFPRPPKTSSTDEP